MSDRSPDEYDGRSVRIVVGRWLKEVRKEHACRPNALNR